MLVAYLRRIGCCLPTEEQPYSIVLHRLLMFTLQSSNEHLHTGGCQIASSFQPLQWVMEDCASDDFTIKYYVTESIILKRKIFNTLCGLTTCRKDAKLSTSGGTRQASPNDNDLLATRADIRAHASVLKDTSFFHQLHRQSNDGEKISIVSHGICEQSTLHFHDQAYNSTSAWYISGTSCTGRFKAIKQPR